MLAGGECGLGVRGGGADEAVERGEADWEVSSECERIGGRRYTPGISVSVSVGMRRRGEEKGGCCGRCRRYGW